MGNARDDLVARIWARDASVWPPGEDDPARRLGWLDLPESMRPALESLAAFGARAAEDFDRVVLLGMGGASLAPEVFAEVLGAAPGRPGLVVLDSTHPAQIAATEAGTDLGRTLFLVASKSGTTLETVSLFRYFRTRCEPDQFVAITDPGTPLEALATGENFRAVFINTPDVGGRYSALSLFGLLPAALLGIDLEDLVGRAGETARSCRAGATRDNPGYALGDRIGSDAREGRDKLTFLTSDALWPFVDWIEQLIAESTGKTGRGIAPIVHEPLLDAGAYGEDRAFVRLCLAGDDTHDAAVSELEARGHGVTTVPVADAGALGAEMFRWEFATAVACAILGVNAFDQPDVESAKRAALGALDESGRDAWPADDPGAVFEGAGPGDLACLLAFAPRTEAHSAMLSEGRARLVRAHRVATSAGFGPRYLHSTGQLHKGGPAGVRALVILDEPEDDIEIPAPPHSFARLLHAQATGDAEALRAAGKRVARTSWAAFEQWARQ